MSKKEEKSRPKTLYMAASGGGTEGDGQTSPSTSVQPALAGHGRHGGHHHHHHTNRHRRHKHVSASQPNNEPLYDRKLSPFDEKSEMAVSTTGRQGAGLPPPTKPKPVNPLVQQQHYQEERRGVHGKQTEII